MSQECRTQERAARHVAPIVTCALALAAVVAFSRPAAAQGTSCGTEGTVLCGTVFNDANMNGTQDAGEVGWGGITVTACVLVNGACDANQTYSTTTQPDGTYSFSSQDLPPT